MQRKSVTIPTMLEPLGVMPSCSRPAVSNDPFSGVLFKTLKYLATHIVPARIFGWTSQCFLWSLPCVGPSDGRVLGFQGHAKHL